MAPVKIVSLMPFGAFAEIVDGVDGLIHISEIADHRIGKPADVLQVGQVVDAKILDIDSEKQKVALSIRALLEAARDLGASSMTVFRRVILPLSLPGVISGITMVFVPSVSTFAISRMLGGGTELLLGDLIERQFLGGAYNPQLGAAISLVMMVIVVICMLVMNRFGEGEEQAVML